MNLNLSTSQIANFKRDPKAFKRWIEAIQKHAMLEGISIEKVTYLAFKTSTGTVSDFIQIYLNTGQRVEWDQLKAEPSKRFVKIPDVQHAFMLLRQVKQERNENVHIYADRLLHVFLDHQAYEGAHV